MAFNRFHLSLVKCKSDLSVQWHFFCRDIIASPIANQAGELLPIFSKIGVEAWMVITMFFFRANYNSSNVFRNPHIYICLLSFCQS